MFTLCCNTTVHAGQGLGGNRKLPQEQEEVEQVELQAEGTCILTDELYDDFII